MAFSDAPSESPEGLTVTEAVRSVTWRLTSEPASEPQRRSISVPCTTPS